MHAAPDTNALIGRVLGDQFRIERFLGRGGMGAVYLAEQLEVQRRVVIKLLSAARFARTNHEERFKHEARVLAQLNHPNIVHLYAFGRADDGLAYLAMEYVEGRTLAKLVAETGALPEPEVLRILDQLCCALIEAHGHGVIHRDLKPDNVMLVERIEARAQAPAPAVADSAIKVLDFGIAKLTHAAEQRITRNGEVLGTPLYMAPEQLHGGNADERTDIYSLGVIGYELLTGQVPFEADTTIELLARVMNEPALPPSLKAPGIDISPAIEGLLMRCLSKDPAQRHQSAQELRDALAEITTPRESVPPSAAADALQLTIYDAAAPPLSRAQLNHSGGRGRARLWAAALLLALVVAGARWLGEPSQLTAALAALLSPAPPATDADAPRSGPLPLREWVQGIPFPIGTAYVTFDDTFIEARVPADEQRVIAFYRDHFASKWGGFRALVNGLTFESPLAPVEELIVTPFREGSRVVITRRYSHSGDRGTGSAAPGLREQSQP